MLPEVQKKIDLSVKKNLIHANKGARQKSQCAKMVAKAPVKKTTTPAAEKKAPAAKKEEEKK